ncbi:MAG: hypothetical protein GXO50_10525 [Chlorobi bacterium]|nr:hypothetical protein [Chlorobiota bacterium]
MKNIFKLSVLLTLMFAGTFYSPNTARAQVNYSDNMDENRLVYWFYVSVREKEDSETGYVSYNLQLKGNRIQHGSQKDYDRELWKYLGNGQKMAIGPFNEYEEAKKAILFYKIQDKPHELDSTYDENQTVFWFVLHVNRRPRSNSYQLIRKPGAIASGTYHDFDVFLKENLMMRVMTVGPFNYMPEAEEAKRIYRLH